MFRLVLVNLCETAWGYGPGASEYLRAQVLSTPDLAERVAVEILFLEGLAAPEVAERVLRASPDLVGFSCYSWNLAASAAASRAIRRLAPEVPIVWGGCSFSHLRRRSDWFRYWDAVDAVAVGFAEGTLVELLRYCLSRPGPLRFAEPLPGLVIATDGAPRFGPPAPQPARLASPYLMGIARPVRRPYIEMARGCIFRCTFCSDARGSRDGVFLTHPADRIAEEVAQVVRWPEAEWIDAGASTANVTDVAFAAVCEAIRRGDPAQRLVYSFQMYPSLVRPSQRAALEGIRVAKIVLGLQSTTYETFAPMRRAGSLAHLLRALDILRGVGPLNVSVLLGLPGETVESFCAMFDLLLEQTEASLSIHRLLALPGTEMHTRAEEMGIEFDPEAFYRVTRTRTMSAGDLKRAQEHVLSRAAALPRGDGPPRVDWTNFDVQHQAFDPPVLPRPAPLPSQNPAAALLGEDHAERWRAIFRRKEKWTTFRYVKRSERERQARLFSSLRLLDESGPMALYRGMIGTRSEPSLRVSVYVVVYDDGRVAEEQVRRAVVLLAG